MNIMLCGANDIKDILPFFNEVSKEIGFQALNFINGDVMYHNYGEDKWVRNSKLTVHNADVLVFVINSKYGELTWNTEFETALQSGKNFIVLCNTETYQFYRQLADSKLRIAKTKESKNINLIYQLIQKLELEEKVTIVTFSLIELKGILKKHLLALFKKGIGLLESENKKNSFLPVLMSSAFNDAPKKFINTRNEELCRELLFDYFENKEIRKRAMDYFMTSKTLSEDDIIKICLDPEQGVARKAVQHINLLVAKKHDLALLFAEIIPSVANEEVGIVRRAIASFIELDLSKSIEYFHLFFPSADVGTPRRIIMAFRDRIATLKQLFRKEKDLVKTFVDLISLCINYKTEAGGWKEQADFLLKTFG